MFVGGGGRTWPLQSCGSSFGHPQDAERVADEEEDGEDAEGEAQHRVHGDDNNIAKETRIVKCAFLDQGCVCVGGCRGEGSRRADGLAEKEGGGLKGDHL